MNPFTRYLKYLFSLDRDRIDPVAVISQIKAGIEFKGTNLWILIFAIFVASLGLNVNSTAVIIGAMLISPLMGPIMGIGLGLGINDFQVFRNSFYNLGVAYIIGIITSTFFFLLSPVYGQQSELLARTTPTVYDVLIAFFGGLAGIVATSSKERGNVLPGVAIATALMPPLCTAGYGIAIGNLYYFLGAFYLLFINTVFICLATYLMVRFLRFPYHEYPDTHIRKKMKFWIMVIVFTTFIPSVIIAWIMIERNIYTNNANRFIDSEMTFPGNILLSKNISPGNRCIDVTYIGPGIDSLNIENATKKLPDYHLKNTKITVTQGLKNTSFDLTKMRALVVGDLRRIAADTTAKQVEELKAELEKYRQGLATPEMVREARALFPGVQHISVVYAPLRDVLSEETDSVYIAYLTFSSLPKASERRQLENWLKAKFTPGDIRIIIQKN